MIIKIKQITIRKEKIIVLIASYSTIFNFMYIENLYFVEAAVMAMSILLYVLSVKILVEKNKKYIIKSIILAILATFCYQGTIAFYLVFAFTIFLLMYPKQPKKIATYTSIVLGFCLLSFIINVIQIKIVGNFLDMQQARMVGLEEIIVNTIEVLTNFINIVIKTVWAKSCGLFLPYLMLIYLAVYYIIATIHSIKEKDAYLVVHSFALILLTMIASIGMCIISYGSYDTGRIHMETGSLIGLIALLGIGQIDNKNEKQASFQVIPTIWCFLIVSYTILNMSNYVVMLQEHKKVNKLEEEYCKIIEQKIKEHEEKSGIKVTNVVGIKRFSKQKCYYEEVKAKNVLTYDGLRCTWSYAGTINHYTGRKLRQINATSVHRQRYVEIFGTDPEREDIICIQDTLYFPIYL